MDSFPENVLELLNENLGGFNNAMGLKFIKATPDEYVAEIEIADQHIQPYGLVHGGVYAGMIETMCSTGAALTVWQENKSTVGLENNTSFRVESLLCQILQLGVRARRFRLNPFTWMIFLSPISNSSIS